MKQDLQKIWLAFLFPLLFTALLWVVKYLENLYGWDLTSQGILPREISGLQGVFFAPLIHADINHLINNSLPILMLGWAIAYFYTSLFFRLFVLSYLLAGLYTWISARYAYHIGASGLVYAWFGFLFFSGFIRRHLQLIAISFLVAFLYGSMVWGVLPWDHTKSWEGHFWGLFVGLILAIYYRKQGPQRKVYHWPEEDEEEDIPPPYMKPLTGEVPQEKRSESKVKVVYHYVPAPRKQVEGKG